MPGNLELLKKIATKAAADTIAETLTPTGQPITQVSQPKEKGVLGKIVNQTIDQTIKPAKGIKTEKKSGAFQIGLQEANTKTKAELGARTGLWFGGLLNTLTEGFDSPVEGLTPSLEEIKAKRDTRKERADKAKKSAKKAAGGIGKGAKTVGEGISRVIKNRRAKKTSNETGIIVRNSQDDDEDVIDGEFTVL